MHELELHSLASMPHPTLVRLVQDCCRQLQLREAPLLPAALHRMCKALGALPPMEAFIRDVCTIARSQGGAPQPRTGSDSSTKAVLKVLRRWSEDIKQLQQLQDLVALLSESLAKRSVPGGALESASHPASASAGRGGSEDVLAPRDILSAVEELVAQEARALRTAETLKRADMHLQLEPEDVVSKLCAHFSRLFDVRGTEGILPKMNELYLFVHEQASLKNVMRSMLGLEPTASSEQLIAAIRQALDLSADREQSDADAAESTASAPPASTPPPARSTGVVSSASASDPQQKALPQYIAIAADLRKMLRANSILSIVPAVKQLQAELSRHKAANHEMQALITQLCNTLSISSSEAQIVQRLQKLVTIPEGDD